VLRKFPEGAFRNTLKPARLRPAMLAAAARELRRAHQCPCEAFDGPWVARRSACWKFHLRCGS